MTRTPQDAISDFVVKYEGEFQNDPDDLGNYVILDDGRHRLVGTMRGVTAAAFCNYQGINVSEITPELLQDSVTLDIAVDIGMEKFYHGLNIHMLGWSASTEVILDYVWGSGWKAIERIQRMIKTVDDGVIGKNTANAWKVWQMNNSVPDQLVALCALRISHYKDIGVRFPAKQKYVEGWKRRALDFLHDTPWFQNNWK